MLEERGVKVDHTTIYRWVQYYAPKLLDQLKWYWKGRRSSTWYVDETYIKIRGKWHYLYRAVDERGHTIDFYLSKTRTTHAAKRFLGKAVRKLKEWEHPKVINTDKNAAYLGAIRGLKGGNKLESDLIHRKVKYLNNRIEGDHARLKRIMKPKAGFKSMKSAYATIKGIELMRMFRKGRFDIWLRGEGVKGEVRLITQNLMAC